MSCTNKWGQTAIMQLRDGKGVICQECNQKKIIMTKVHLKIYHNMTKEEYLKKHPGHNHPAIWGVLQSNKKKSKEVGSK